MAKVFNVGLDLGTSNTVCSYVDEDGKIKNFKYLDSEQTPSVVYSKNNTTLIGYQARRKYELTRGQGLYRSYKMHTHIKDQKELERLNYKDMTPSEVMEQFLLTYAEAFMEEMDIEKMNSIVVGAPETFFQTPQGADMRTELREIVKRCNIAEKDRVRVVSEPAAAAAYYFYLNDKKSAEEDAGQKPNENAYLCLIDAGGGTLDLNLARISRRNGKLTIHIVARAGAGEHHDEVKSKKETIVESKSYGRSGVFYFEEVLRAAILNQYPEMTEIDENNDFKKAFNELEDYMKRPPRKSETEMKNYFRDRFYGLDDELEEEKKAGFTIEYGEDDLRITYELMFDVYERTFKLVLEHELDAIRNYTKSKNIAVPYGIDEEDESGEATFKVVTVGGFSAFPLVRYQIERYFNKFSADDPRFDTISASEASFAVANGLALLANGDVEYSMNAPYGLSIIKRTSQKDEEGEKTMDIAWNGVVYGDELNPGKDMEEPFYVHVGNRKTKEERKEKRQLLMGNDLKIIGYDNGKLGVVKHKVSWKLQNMIKQIIDKYTSPEGIKPYYYMGFSFDESSQLYIHITEFSDAWTERLGPLKFDDILDGEVDAVEVVEVV